MGTLTPPVSSPCQGEEGLEQPDSGVVVLSAGEWKILELWIRKNNFLIALFAARPFPFCWIYPCRRSPTSKIAKCVAALLKSATAWPRERWKIFGRECLDPRPNRLGPEISIEAPGAIWRFTRHETKSSCHPEPAAGWPGKSQ